MTFPDSAPVAVDGVRFAVRRAGPATSTHPPVLLLHGVPQTSSVWRELMPVLAEDRVVIAPDLKGLGGSEHRPPYDRPTLARELAALVLHVLDEMGVGGEDGTRIDVVGHDFGGVMALALAGERPDLVRRLVIAAAPYRKVDLLKAFHVPLFALPVVPELVLRRVSFARAAYGRAWKAATPPDRARVDADAAAYAGDDRIAGMLAYYRASVKAARTPAPDVVVERALVVWGADDPAMPISVGEAVVKDLGRAGTDPANVRMIVANNAGHFVLEEAADVVLPAIVAFLRDGDDEAAAASPEPAVTRATGPAARVEAPTPVPPASPAPEPEPEPEPAPVGEDPHKPTPADIPPKKSTRTRTRTNQSAAKRIAAKKGSTPPAAGATPAARAVQKAAAKSTANKPTPRVAPAGAGNDADMVDIPLEADPADVAEQQRDAVPPPIDLDGEAAGVSTDANRVVDVTDEEGADQLPLDEG